jgi:hypothetical protein
MLVSRLALRLWHSLTSFIEQLEQIIKLIEENVGSQSWQSAKASAIKLRYLEGIRRAVDGKLQEDT